MEKLVEAVEVFDVVAFVMGFEDGVLPKEKVIEGFQHLIDTGIVWSLQSSYGGMASHLIEQGHCKRADA